MRGAARLAALSNYKVAFVWTHDSVGLGEDGPTHQPIEQLASFRAMPNMRVIRPADANECAHAWRVHIDSDGGPTALVLTRQKLPKLARASSDPEQLFRGGYVVQDAPDAKVTVVATGSEVATAQGALALLAAKGIQARLVSMPCLECFEAQPASYRDAVVPPGHRVAVVEAARGLEWWRLAGKDGLVLGIDRFGESAPEKALAAEFGFTPAQVAEKIERWLG